MNYTFFWAYFKSTKNYPLSLSLNEVIGNVQQTAQLRYNYRYMVVKLKEIFRIYQQFEKLGTSAAKDQGDNQRAYMFL